MFSFVDLSGYLSATLFELQDSLVETAKEQASSISNIIAQATK
jgi:hypothetical protein